MPGDDRDFTGGAAASAGARRAEPGDGAVRSPVPDVVPVVTLASLHGSGGARIAPRLAERLGVAFLDRALPAAVAERQGVPVSAVESLGRPQGWRDRVVELLSKASVSASDDRAAAEFSGQERALRNEIDDFLAQASGRGGVVLGRGGVVVLRSVPGALHGYLGGPVEARVRRTMEVEGVDRQAAEHQVRVYDRARRQYLQDAYGVDGDDPSLYHVILDTTAFDEEACVELLVAASRARQEHARRTRGEEHR